MPDSTFSLVKKTLLYELHVIIVIIYEKPTLLSEFYFLGINIGLLILLFISSAYKYNKLRH